MSYQATVIQVMIASPGDVANERQVIRDVIHDWNYVHSFAAKAVLLPVGWETHSSPDLSGRPQELINERVLKHCDLLVGIFWTRLGSPTGRSASGSVEEIVRHRETGKPVMIYFSAAPVQPDQLDHVQYRALQDFRRWCQGEGLIQEFDGLPQLGKKFAHQLPIMLRGNPYLGAILDRPESGDRVNGTVSVEAPGSSLYDEAKQLLMEAAEAQNGLVLRIDSSRSNERVYQTHGKAFGRGADARSAARWAHAFDQLIDEGLLSPKGPSGKVFNVTASGYDLADLLRGA
jgi:hypothetical protein